MVYTDSGSTKSGGRKPPESVAVLTGILSRLSSFADKVRICSTTFVFVIIRATSSGSRGATAIADSSLVILDEEDRVAGYIFGVLEKDFFSQVRRFWSLVLFGVRVFYYFLAGLFGPWKSTWNRAKELFSMEEELESKKSKTDGYDSLFFVSSNTIVSPGDFGGFIEFLPPIFPVMVVVQMVIFIQYRCNR